MSNLQETPSYRTREKDEQSIDIKSIVYIFLSHWYLFLICAAVALAAGWLYNRFSAPAYQVSGTVLIKENRSSLDPTSIMTNGSYGNSQNLDNEIAIMKSYSLRERVVKKMKMEVSYYDNSSFVTNEMYKSSPFIVEFDPEVSQAVRLVYNIVINGDKLSLKAESKYHAQYDYSNEQFVVQRREEKIAINGEYSFDEWIDTGYNRFRITKASSYNPNIHDGRKMSFVFYDYLSLTNQMAFSVSNISKQASIVSVSMTGGNRRKMVEFINTLMNEYVNRGLERKNMVSENTIEFIDKQLEETENNLNKAEIDLQDFRTTHDLTNLNAQSSQVISALQNLEQDHAALLVNQQYYKRLQSYIRENIDNPDNLAAPSAMA